jgi:hypothetical protein
MKKLLVFLAFVAASALAWALPSVQQVEAEVQQGHTVRAEAMMGEVVAAKPGSARAHYVYAEILARNGKFKLAAEEEAKARQIDPDAKFADPAKVLAFEQLLDREQLGVSRTPAAPAQQGAVAPMSAPARAAGMPSWIWMAALAAIAFFLWRGLSRSRAAATGSLAGAPGSVGMPPYAGGPTMNPAAPYGSGMQPGSGLLGTGMAVAGGVAGGMLLDELLHHRNGLGNSTGGGVFGSGGGAPAPGNDAATELEARPVDFGNGNDWDSGGGSVDVGGGDGSGWDS